MESISRISGFLETARDLTLEAASSSSARKTSNRTIPPAQLKKLLDSRNDRDILDGLRRIISMMYRNHPCQTYFSNVVNNVTSPNLEVKKLVYIYILHYAESEPDTALLAINGIQKSLTDQNPQVRALALRTMAGIRVPAISQIVSLGIKRACADMSPHVRKAAALAIPKCYRLDPSTLPQLLQYFSILLGDKQYYVAGPAVLAFMEISPDRIDLIHQHYRSLVRKLVDMDEWSQLATLRLMTIYARNCFPRRRQRIKKTGKAKGFYDDEGPGDESGSASGEEIEVVDPDLDLLLKSALPLLQSRNSAVVIGVARCYFYLSPDKYLLHAVGPIISLLRSPPDVLVPALHCVLQICLSEPVTFASYATHFLIHANEPPQVRHLKLELLTVIFPHSKSNIQALILNELEHFSRCSSHPELVREAVRAIGRCAAHSDAHTANRCLHLLLTHVQSFSPSLVAESLTVIRHLIQRDPGAHRKTVIRLAKNLDTLQNPQARSSIIWLVGEFAGINWPNNIAPDVLRILVRGFAEESESVKLQIVLLGAKVYVHHLNALQAAKNTAVDAKTEALGMSPPRDAYDEYAGSREAWLDSTTNSADDATSTGAAAPKQKDEDDRITQLWHHILTLARYDTSYDLRDRTRVYKALLASPTSTQLASLLLLAPKPVPQTPSPSEARRGLVIGSASLVVGERGLRGHEEIPEWVRSGEEPDPQLRREDDAVGRGEYVGGAARVVPAGEMLDSALRNRGGKVDGEGRRGGKERTLDEWLDEAGEEEGEDSGSEEETETEEESGEETGEGESEEEESSSASEKGTLLDKVR